MPTLMIEYTTEAERLALEQAIAFCSQMRHTAATAPDGTVLAACERVALGAGRQLLRDTLAAAAQSRADAAGEKKVPRGGARAAAPVGTKGTTPVG